MVAITDYEAAFWDRVDRSESDGCWPWVGSRFASGYGDLNSWAGRAGWSRRAHRASWEMHFGPVPDGMVVCHHCDNPPCVNPTHLFLGSDLDNIADRDAKGRQARGERSGTHVYPERVLRGERLPSSKLTDAKVREIRVLYAFGVRVPVLAALFDVHKNTVWMLLAGKTWRHVT